jgi:pimeloyl-ACP methyl ester carboxylesterase
MKVRKKIVILLCLATVLVSIGAVAAEQNPVLLIHGYNSDSSIWTGSKVRQDIEASGRTVYTFDIPNPTGDIRLNASSLQDNISKIRATTGASKVDLVAHSMGGLLARYYVTSDGPNSTYQGDVSSLTMLDTPNHGTGWAMWSLTPAGKQMKPNSDFLKDLNARQVPEDITVVSVVGKGDKIVSEKSARLNIDEAANIDNIVITSNKTDGFWRHGTYNNAEASMHAIGTLDGYYDPVGPVPPIPELPSIVLFSVGLLALAGYVGLRRRKNN